MDKLPATFFVADPHWICKMIFSWAVTKAIASPDEFPVLVPQYIQYPAARYYGTNNNQIFNTSGDIQITVQQIPRSPVSNQPVAAISSCETWCQSNRSSGWGRRCKYGLPHVRDRHTCFIADFNAMFRQRFAQLTKVDTARVSAPGATALPYILGCRDPLR